MDFYTIQKGDNKLRAYKRMKPDVIGKGEVDEYIVSVEVYNNQHYQFEMEIAKLKEISRDFFVTRLSDNQTFRYVFKPTKEEGEECISFLKEN